MSEKLDDPKVSAESYLSIVDSFLNIIKIPNILPIKVNNILYLTLQLCQMFLYFAAQCTPIDNLSKLLVFRYKIELRLN